MIVVAIAALIGGRLYHVIDQWALYAADPITAILPITVQANGSYAFAGFSGLGVPGGIVTGTLAGWSSPVAGSSTSGRWADIVAPGLFVMQAIGRLGNFFNQELYGPADDRCRGASRSTASIGSPTTRARRSQSTTTHFHPLFLYESLSGLLGAVVLLWLAPAPQLAAPTRRPAPDLLRLVRDDPLRAGVPADGNWTFFGIPTAQIVSAIFVLGRDLGAAASDPGRAVAVRDAGDRRRAARRGARPTSSTDAELDATARTTTARATDVPTD